MKPDLRVERRRPTRESPTPRPVIPQALAWELLEALLALRLFEDASGPCWCVGDGLSGPHKAGCCRARAAHAKVPRW